MKKDAEWIKEFHKKLEKQDLSQRTISGYVSDLLFFQKWLHQMHPNGISFFEVTKKDVKAFRQDLLDLKQQKASSVNRRIQSLKRFFDWAHRKGSVII